MEEFEGKAEENDVHNNESTHQNEQEKKIKQKPFSKYVYAHNILNNDPKKGKQNTFLIKRIVTFIILMFIVIFAILYLPTIGQTPKSNNPNSLLVKKEITSNSKKTENAKPQIEKKESLELDKNEKAVLLDPTAISGYFFIDRMDTRPKELVKQDVLQTGDSIMAVAKARGWEYLYIILLHPTNRLRLSKIYPPDMMKRTAPPVKFTFRDKVSGKYQVIFLATNEELLDIQKWIVNTNYTELKSKDIGTARVKSFLSLLKKELKDKKWSHYELKSLDYIYEETK